MVNDYNYTNLTQAGTSMSGTWVESTASLVTRNAFLAINQGVNNDMATGCNIEIIAQPPTDTAPTSSATKGIILQLGDAIEFPLTNEDNVYWRSTTTNATLEFVEFEKRVV